MIHINRFIDRIKFFESKNSKEFVMSTKDAKDLHSDITKLLLVLQELQEKAAEDQEIKVNVDGGKW